jgi:hypothetical protein
MDSVGNSALGAGDAARLDAGEGRLHHGAELVGQALFAQHVVGTEAHGLDDVAGGGGAAEKDDHGLRVVLAQAFEQLDARWCRHRPADFGEQQVGAFFR